MNQNICVFMIQLLQSSFFLPTALISCYFKTNHSLSHKPIQHMNSQSQWLFYYSTNFSSVQHTEVQSANQQQDMQFITSSWLKSGKWLFWFVFNIISTKICDNLWIYKLLCRSVVGRSIKSVEHILQITVGLMHVQWTQAPVFTRIAKHTIQQEHD